MEPAHAIERLAFIKGVFRVGVEISRRAEPMSSVAVLLFHDAVEQWLRLAAEYLDVRLTRTGFLDYWDQLSSRLPEPLPQKETMRRFNEARVGLKHFGILISRADVEAFRTSVDSFFQDATRLVFHVSFAEISLLDLVPAGETRSLLQTASSRLGAGDVPGAVDDVAKAFETLVPMFGANRVSLPGRPTVQVAEGFPPFHSFGVEAEVYDALQTVSQALDARISMLELGIDIQRYRRFQVFMPYVTRSHSGSWQVRRSPGYHPVFDASPAEARECLDFVVEAALVLSRNATAAQLPEDDAEGDTSKNADSPG